MYSIDVAYASTYIILKYFTPRKAIKLLRDNGFLRFEKTFLATRTGFKEKEDEDQRCIRILNIKYDRRKRIRKSF